MIENVLKIMNAPTSSAMTAKIIMNVLKKPMACWNESCFSLVTVAPVTASIPCGSACGGCCELLLRDARLGHEQDAGDLPGPATRRCATGMVNKRRWRRPGCRPCRT